LADGLCDFGGGESLWLKASIIGEAGSRPVGKSLFWSIRRKVGEGERKQGSFRGLEEGYG
jgi:hypothetical protein